MKSEKTMFSVEFYWISHHEVLPLLALSHSLVCALLAMLRAMLRYRVLKRFFCDILWISHQYALRCWQFVEKTNTILIFPYGNHGNEKRSLYLYGFQWPRAYVLYLERLNKFEHFSFIEHFKKFEYFSFIEHFEKFEHF